MGPRSRHRCRARREVAPDRLRVFVTSDVERAAQLHADDFHLINPLGGALSRDQYLGSIGSGQSRYLHWEAGWR